MCKNEKLSEFKVKILKELNGEPQDDICWGAGMAAALEFLKEDGYVAGLYHITDRGKQYLKENT